MAPRAFDRYMVSIGMGTHPKLAHLTDAEFRAHVVGVLAVAAMAPVRGYLLIGTLPAEAVHIAAAAKVPVRAARSAMEKLVAVGVLVHDSERGCYRVHDWDDVNPSPGAQRTKRWRDAKRDADVTSDRHTDRHQAVTETSPEVEGEVEAPTENTITSDADGADAKATDEDRAMCRLLRELALDRNPKFKVKSGARWLTDMRRLRELDGNSAAEIETVLRWVFAHHFWSGVIQSPGNFREHFPQIWAQMHSGSPSLHVVDGGPEREERRNRGAAALDGLMKRAKEGGASA